MWPKKTIYWTQNNSAFVSVPFTWNLPQAYSTCVWLRQEGYDVWAGGPAVSLMPDMLREVAQLGDSVNALPRHNPDATVTSRGCIRHCKFCAVPIIEGDLVELSTWEPKFIVCDNNLLACSRRHFDRVIDSLKPLRGVDFNQGLDARLLTSYHIDRLRELNVSVIRLAWDDVNLESIITDALNRLLAAGFSKRKLRVYVLLGFDDTPEDALYRLETLKARGIRPNPQRYNPLDTLKRDSYVSPNWTDYELHRYMRYWSRQNWLERIAFEDYQPFMYG